MADTVTTITNLVNSPPGQFAAGGVLAGIVWKFFEQVEGLLRENTRLEIAGWLMDIRVGRHIPRWQSALPVYFRLVCGPRYSRRRLYVVLCMSLVSFLTAYSPIVLAFRVLRNPPLFSSQVAFDLLVFVSCSVQSLLILLLIDEILLEGEDKVQMYKPVISMLILIGLATLVISC